MSSLFAKISLIGLGSATVGGLFTYCAIVPSDKKPHFINKAGQLETQLGVKKEELENKEKEAGVKYTQLLGAWTENAKYKKTQDCLDTKMKDFPKKGAWIELDKCQ